MMICSPNNNIQASKNVSIYSTSVSNMLMRHLLSRTTAYSCQPLQEINQTVLNCNNFSIDSSTTDTTVISIETVALISACDNQTSNESKCEKPIYLTFNSIPGCLNFENGFPVFQEKIFGFPVDFH